jgi:hypothetical protein
VQELFLACHVIKRMMKLMFALMMSAFSCSLAAQEYFPLQSGNNWVYRDAFGQTQVIQVGEPQQRSGVSWHEVNFLGQKLLLRRTDDGRILKLEETGMEKLFLHPDATARFESSLDDCSPAAQVSSRNKKAERPIGTFESILEIRYEPGNCADAGAISTELLPWVGILRHTTQSIAGPRHLDLVYARVGDSLQVGAPETGFALSLSSNSYVSGAMLSARLSIRHTLPSPLELNFPSTQQYDLAIVNEAGERVVVWSANKLFAAILTKVKVAGEHSFTVSMSLNDLSGQRLPPGNYALEAWLPSRETPQLRATVPFRITSGGL